MRLKTFNFDERLNLINLEIFLLKKNDGLKIILTVFSV